MFSKNKNSLEKKSRNDVISEVTTLPPELSELITFFESPDISDLFNLFMQLGKDNRVFFEKKHDIWAKIDSIKEDYSTNRITLNHQTFTDPKETKKYNELIDQYNPISKVYHKMLELWTFMAKTLYQLEPNNPILGWIPTSSDENIRRTKPLDLDDIIGFKEKLIELRDYIETYIKEIPNMTVKYTSFLFFSETANSKNVAGHFLILLDEKLNFLKYAFDAFDVLGMPQLREAKTSDTIKKQNRDAKNSTQGTPEVKSLDEDSEDSKRSSLQISHSQQSSEQPDSKLSAGLYQIKQIMLPLIQYGDSDFVKDNSDLHCSIYNLVIKIFTLLTRYQNEPEEQVDIQQALLDSIRIESEREEFKNTAVYQNTLEQLSNNIYEYTAHPGVMNTMGR